MKQYYKQIAIDILDEFEEFLAEKGVDIPNPEKAERSRQHGKNPVLPASAAMAAMTALGFSWSDMIQDAKAFVFGSLRENVEIGKGIFAMYPPVEDSLELIEMERISSAKSSKGSPR